MKYKCEVCGDEFDDIDEARMHENQHIMAEQDDHSRVKLLEEHVKELQAKMACLERENRSLGDRLEAIETTMLYHPENTTMRHECRLSHGRKRHGDSVVTSSVREFPGINSDDFTKWWEEGDDGK